MSNSFSYDMPVTLEKQSENSAIQVKLVLVCKTGGGKRRRKNPTEKHTHSTHTKGHFLTSLCLHKNRSEIDDTVGDKHLIGRITR